MRADLLHVVAVYANPMRWETRSKIHAEFESHMLESGVLLTTVECAFGERPFELEDNPNINRVRVRGKTIMWIKENLMNIGISRLPSDWKYVMCSDADIHFRRRSWASEAVHALQQYEVIQPWSDAYDLGPQDDHIKHHRGFVRQWWHDHPVCQVGKKGWAFQGGPYEYPHSGYAWCYTRNAIEWLGGLIDIGVTGAGDHHMALSLVGKAEYSLPTGLGIPGGVTKNYSDAIFTWQDRATHHINQNIGFTWGTIEHRWHGRKNDRKYMDRWRIILDYQFDPLTDIKKNSFGVNELTGNKPRMTHALDRYFRQRNENANTID